MTNSWGEKCKKSLKLRKGRLWGFVLKKFHLCWLPVLRPYELHGRMKRSRGREDNTFPWWSKFEFYSFGFLWYSNQVRKYIRFEVRLQHCWPWRADGHGTSRRGRPPDSHPSVSAHRSCWQVLIVLPLKNSFLLPARPTTAEKSFFHHPPLSCDSIASTTQWHLATSRLMRPWFLALQYNSSCLTWQSPTTNGWTRNPDKRIREARDGR